MRVHSYASTRRCVLVKSTHKERDQILSSDAKPDSRHKWEIYSPINPHLSPFLEGLQVMLRKYTRPCIHRFRSGTGFSISIDQPPSYFTPTYHFTCPTRRPSSYHEAASRHISPLLAPRPTFSQTSPLLRCQESAPFWYIVLNPNESVKMVLRYFPSDYSLRIDF